MDAGAVPEAAPSPAAVRDVFEVHGVRRDGERVLYFGEPTESDEEVVSALWEPFRDAGYEITLESQRDPSDQDLRVIVAEPVDLGITGIPWTNLVLFVATIVSTLYVGAAWYHIDLGGDPLAMLGAWPFAAGVLAVLGIHELGHYVASRYYGVRASLPYFLPVPTIFGTMGAVISIKGRIPDRRALFDIGIAGPIAGLGATVVVTIIGLHLPPVTAPTEVIESEAAVQLSIGYPPLLEMLAWVFDQPLSYAEPGMAANPVVIAGWLGMFITFLNLIPVGQLDGGHVTRAMFGPRQRALGHLVPLILVVLAGVAVWILDAAVHAVIVWVVWAGFAVVLAIVGPASPVVDTPIGRRRWVLGLATLASGLLCFTPVPIEIVG